MQNQTTPPIETPETPPPDFTLPTVNYRGQPINPAGSTPGVILELLTDSQIFEIYSRAYGILHTFNTTEHDSEAHYQAVLMAQEVRSACYHVLIDRFADKLRAAADSHMRKTS